MSAPEKAPGVPALRVSTATLGGIAALGFAVSVALQNFVFLLGVPEPGTDLGQAASWYAANRGRAAAAGALVGLNFPLLLVFAAMMRELGRASEAGRRWMTLGTLGAAAMVGVFTVVTAGQIAAVLFAEAGATDAFAAVWVMHNAAFALTLPVLGTALLGFALGAHAAGLTATWQLPAGLVGATLLIGTGAANTLVADGSPVIFVGFGGFALWILWLAATGIGLLRRRS